MRKERVKEISFGKGVARITVTGFEIVDGIGKRFNLSSVVEIINADGKVIAEDFHANVHNYGHFSSKSFFEKGGLDTNEVYTTVGSIITKGDVGNEINAAIKEMKAEVEAEFKVVSKESKEAQEEIEVAKEIIEQAKIEGIENLKSAAGLKVWRKKYNDLHNEGGEGFIPRKISKEAYNYALSVANGRN